MKFIIFKPGSNIGEILQEEHLPFAIKEQYSIYPVGTHAYFCGGNNKANWATLDRSKTLSNQIVAWYWDYNFSPNKEQKLQILLLS
jgi:hypothetical protein